MAALVAVLVYFLALAHAKDPTIEEEELNAYNLILSINEKMEKNLNRKTLAEWAYASNLTKANLDHNLAVSTEVANFQKEIWRQVNQYNWQQFSDYSLRRQFWYYSVIGEPALPEAKYKMLTKLVSDMESIYSTAKICELNNPNKCDLALEPDLTNIMATSNDEKELKHVWIEWRNSVGPKCKDSYKSYVELSNESARLNNFTDQGEFWLKDYEDPNIKEQIQGLWEQLRPLYLQIHAYVRFKLREKFGDLISEKGPIPAHLLGNMWGQTWDNIAERTLPYPDVETIDYTAAMLKQNYTPIKIFKTAEQFFKSINLTEMPETFWKNSILEKPADRELICHASAWDFYDQKDFRIKQCTDVTYEQMNTAHHEMGHIEYFLQYKDQPVPFRNGANDGFHEAVGDCISLSFETTKHLKKIGLISSASQDSKTVLNNLYRVGLAKIAFLPFGYLMDLWRWDVFSGKTTPDNYNCKWWELREKYQGLEPPVDRSEEDFDPAAKYHIIADVPYLRYFISFVVQFQFHRALCEKAGQYEPNNAKKPLHECDIYENTEAGNALKKMLSMGSSRPWPDAMEAITGQRKMDASGLLEYFKPLQEWLEAENKKNGVFIGWEKTKRVCVRNRQELKTGASDE
ncbi:unnamed protein product [Phyllotreta striolata]|nr:unnamed protein product [Phyllotreta striolata]